MADKKFSDLVANADTNLAVAAVGDYILIYDISEPLDINKIKVISVADFMKLTTETGRQALVTGQAAGDLFYASAADALARLAKPEADSVLKNTSAGVPSWEPLSNILNITNRQGGSATDWSDYGTTNYNLSSPPIIQIGSVGLTINSGAQGAYATITFPVAFGGKPLVFPSLMTQANMLDGTFQLFFHSKSDISTTIAKPYLQFTQTQLSTRTHTINWIAIGPVA
jgi:hypothetical protein